MFYYVSYAWCTTVDLSRFDPRQVLSLSHNELREIAPLALLPSLSEVNLNFNHIEDGMKRHLRAESYCKAAVLEGRLSGAQGFEPALRLLAAHESRGSELFCEFKTWLMLAKAMWRF